MLYNDFDLIFCFPPARFRSRAAGELYRAVSQHPNILPPLQSPSTTNSNVFIRCADDSRCYSDFHLENGESNLLRRMWCFPLIEKNEKFVSIDFDSTYSLEPSVPYAINQVFNVFDLSISNWEKI